jgi:signal transduction histidine kinase
MGSNAERSASAGGLLQRATGALLLFAIAQLVFWAMVTLAERQSRPADLSSRDYVEFQILDADGKPIRNGQRFRAEYQGTSGYRTDALDEGETDLFSVLFEVEDTTRQLALFMAIREYMKEVKVNGITVQPDVPLQELQGAVTSEPAYFPLPMNVLQEGYNILTIAKTHEGMVSALPEFSIGPAEELADAYRWKSRYLVDLPLAGVAILAFTIALCLAVNWPREDRERMRWLIAFLFSCMAFTAVMSFLPQAKSLVVTVGMVIGFQLAISISMAGFVALDVAAPRWAHRAIRWAGVLACVVFGGMFAASVLIPSWFEWLFEETLYLSFKLLSAVCALAVIALCWAAAGPGHRRLLERLILVICLTTFAVDRLSSSWDIYSPLDPSLPISLYWSPIVGALLGLGMILSLARQASEARRTVVQSNEILAARLEQQDAELALSYDAQKQMLQRQTMLEERQRIVRDMHDGIGGQLLGLMMQVRSGGADQQQVEEGLQASMADLRLIVDSMDSAEDGLAETLRSFEHRVRAQVESAGIALHVSHGLSEGNPGPGPRPTLQILRVLQEAVTNAMRHSGASEIAIDSNELPEGKILISVRDNGRGIPPQVKGGRGLASMRNRAQTVGGILTVTSSDAGTCLTLELPLPREQ